MQHKITIRSDWSEEETQTMLKALCEKETIDEVISHLPNKIDLLLDERESPNFCSYSSCELFDMQVMDE